MGAVQEIKARIKCSDYIGRYENLKPRGGLKYSCRCPFHDDSTPSFYVRDDWDNWICYGCHRSGDIFDYVQLKFNLSFDEALKRLASETGVEIRRSRAYFDSVFDVLNRAASWYQQQLFRSDAALAYLEGRGLSRTDIETYHLGYCPTHQSISQILNPNDYDVIRAGIFSKYADQFRDLMTGRIVIPIFNPNGDVVAFAGREFDSRNTFAKYVNTPNTPLYQKSRCLYGLNFCSPIDQAPLAIVEGYFDVIALQKLGINAVSPMGIGFSQHQSALIKSAKTICLILDGDDAGQEAALRIIDHLAAFDRIIKVIEMPPKIDPDEYFADYQGGFVDLVNTAPDYVDWIIEKIPPLSQDDIFQRAGLAKRYAPLVAKSDLENISERNIQRLGARLNIAVDALKKMSIQTNMTPNPPESPPPTDYTIEDRFVGAICAEPTLIESIRRIFSRAQVDEFGSRDLSSSKNKQLFDVAMRAYFDDLDPLKAIKALNDPEIDDYLASLPSDATQTDVIRYAVFMRVYHMKEKAQLEPDFEKALNLTAAAHKLRREMSRYIAANLNTA